MPKVRRKKLLSKQQQLTKMKESAWAWFSKFIRLRDCLITMGSKEQGKCVTCGRVYSIKSLQAGHFQEGRGNAILFEEHNCHAQCYGCNIGKHGDQDNYGQILTKMYGLEEVERLRVLKRTTREIDLEEMTAIRDEYKELYQDMLANN